MRELAGGQEDADATRRFLNGWTRKEACLKAAGLGLSIDASTIEVGLDTVDRTVALRFEGQVSEVRVHSVDAGPNLIAAVASIDQPPKHRRE